MGALSYGSLQPLDMANHYNDVTVYSGSTHHTTDENDIHTVVAT